MNNSGKGQGSVYPSAWQKKYLSPKDIRVHFPASFVLSYRLDLKEGVITLVLTDVQESSRDIYAVNYDRNFKFLDIIKVAHDDNVEYSEGSSGIAQKGKIIVDWWTDEQYLSEPSSDEGRDIYTIGADGKFIKSAVMNTVDIAKIPLKELPLNTSKDLKDLPSGKLKDWQIGFFKLRQINSSAGYKWFDLKCRLDLSEKFQSVIVNCYNDSHGSYYLINYDKDHNILGYVNIDGGDDAEGYFSWRSIVYKDKILRENSSMMTGDTINFDGKTEKTYSTYVINENGGFELKDKKAEMIMAET